MTPAPPNLTPAEVEAWTTLGEFDDATRGERYLRAALRTISELRANLDASHRHHAECAEELYQKRAELGRVAVESARTISSLHAMLDDAEREWIATLTRERDYFRSISEKP